MQLDPEVPLLPRTHYPGFDVMSQKDAWDPHTQSVVTKRLQVSPRYEFLTEHEARLIRAIAGHLLYEDRDEVLSFVVAHFDRQLHADRGEAERELNVPPQADLVGWGLAAFDALAKSLHGRPFLECGTQEQLDLIAGLQRGEWHIEGLAEHGALPQKALFKKLLGLAVEAHASHPAVWSEMGYAGPAYPRGYYRIERGLTDPWEPRRAQNGAGVE